MYALTVVTMCLCLNAGAAESDTFKEGWPRLFESKGTQVVVYQPQLTEWEDYKILRAKAAVAVTLRGQETEHFGVLSLETDTDVDYPERMVVMKSLRLTEMVFPNLKSSVALQCRTVVQEVLPQDKVLLISLDRVLAGMERAKIETRTTPVNLDPPRIFYSDQPAILVQFMGEPKFEPISRAPGLLYAVNTNWDIILELGSSKHYLLNETSWLVTENVLNGPWQAAGKLPVSFASLPADENWESVKEHIPGKPAGQVPTLFVSQEPAELIVTEGKCNFGLVPGTKLLYATNTDSDLFLHSADSHHYFLTAGRWFKATTLDGPWQAASADLPPDFAQIPVDHEKAHVLSSVPNTPEADAAVLLAFIPQKATVDRKSTTVTVVYEGTPQFVEIEGTESTVYYAVNTPYSVFRVDQRYYCCHDGVWFEATQSSGPWVVCTKVPGVLYTIPATHPKHNVTYVYVYDSTPDTVEVGYTSGYSGSYVAATGVLMFGLGMWAGYELADYDYPYYYYCHWHPYYYSYGCAPRYDYYYGGYYRSAQYYGPHGGAGGWAGYDPRSGTYYRGGYAKGPYGSAHARQAYNPYTDRSAAQAQVSTPYQSWGRSVVADGDDWARAGHRSQDGKTIAGLETSEGGRAIAGYNKWTGQGAVVGKDKHGDVYVGSDGNVYRRDGDTWQKNSGDGWSNVDMPQARADAQARANERQSQGRRSTQRQSQGQRRSTTPRQSQNRTRSTNRSARTQTRQSRPNVQRDLYRQYQARQWANRMNQGRANWGSMNRGSINRGSMQRSRPSRGGGGRRR